jgi:hypothetical protein
MPKVTVKINPADGTSKYEVEGVQGGACEDLTKALMQNNEVLEHQYTEEYCVPEELPDYVEDMVPEEIDE